MENKKAQDAEAKQERDALVQKARDLIAESPTLIEGLLVEVERLQGVITEGSYPPDGWRSWVRFAKKEGARADAAEAERDEAVKDAVEKLTLEAECYKKFIREADRARKFKDERDRFREVVRLAADERRAFDMGTSCTHTRADMAAALDAAKGGG